MGALRKQMDADMVVRGMSVRTRESYLAAVAGLAKYYGRSPEQVSEAEVQRYLLHLIEEAAADPVARRNRPPDRVDGQS